MSRRKNFVDVQMGLIAPSVSPARALKELACGLGFSALVIAGGYALVFLAIGLGA